MNDNNLIHSNVNLDLQTGSGKTYTMGTGFDIATSPEEEGIIPRAVAHLFEGIDRRKHDAKERNEPQPDFKITVQFMEVQYMLKKSQIFHWG